MDSSSSSRPEGDPNDGARVQLRYGSNLGYKVAVSVLAIFPLGVGMWAIPKIGPFLGVAYIAVVLFRAGHTGVVVSSESIEVRNFCKTSAIEYGKIRDLKKVEVGPDKVVWRVSASCALGIFTVDGPPVYSFCLTEAQSLLPVPRPSSLDAILMRFNGS